MAVLSYGLYLFYWLYLTWKQYRDHTGQEVFPVWHALTLAVPIYGLFRTHAHVRSFKELMFSSGVTSTLSPGWASLTNARIGVGEIILLVIGLLLWFDALMMIFSAGYRAFSSGA